MSETLDPVQAHQHALIEDCAALEEMAATPGWQVFQRVARLWASEHEKVILSGGLTDPLAYKFETGRLQGIRQLLNMRQYLEQARDTALNPDEGYVDELEALDTMPRYPEAQPDEGD